MRDNKNKLEVVNVSFTPDTAEEIVKGQENDEVLREEDLPGELEWLLEEKEEIENIPQKPYESYRNLEEDSQEPSRDTSFKGYVKEEVSRERIKKRSFIGKMSKFCLRAIGIILSIPILMIGIGIMTGGLVASLGIIATGMVGIVFTAFIMTVQPGIVGWLVAFGALGLLSGGGLTLCMVILSMRGIRRIIRLLRGNKINRGLEEGEE